MGTAALTAASSALRIRREHLVPLAILNGAALLLALHFLNNHLNDWGGDNIQFLLLAEALAKGLGYVNLQIPGHPVHAHYPPLYPVLLAPFVWLDVSMITLKAWTAVLSVAGLNVAYFYLVRFRTPLVAGLCVLASLCSEPFIDSGFSTMSDGPYVLFSFAALYLVQRALEREGRWIRAAVAAGVVTGLAILTRTVGVALVPAIGLHALLLRTPALPDVRARLARLAVIGALVAVVASPWAVTVSMKGWSRWSYLQELKGENRTPAGTANASGAGLTTAPAPSPGDATAGRAVNMLPRMKPVYLVGGGLLVALFVIGGLRRRGLDDWYAGAYAIVLALWTPGGMRLAMPLFPILLSQVYEALAFFGAQVDRRVAKPRGESGVRVVFSTLVGGLLAVRLATMLFVPISHERLSGHDAAWWTDYLRAACTVRLFADPGDTVVAHPDNVPFYLAGMQSVRLQAGKRGGNIKRALVESGARFVIVTPFQHYLFGEAIENAIDADPATFPRVVQSGTIEAFEIRRPGQAAATRHPVPPSVRCDAVLKDATFR